jgi:phosphoserine phosphatase
MEFLGPALPNAQAASHGMRELVDDYRSGEVNYRYLVRKAAELYAKCVTGADVDEVRRLALQFAESDFRNLFGFTEALLRTARRKGYSIFVVSGAPAEVIEAYRNVLPIDRVYGLLVERSQGRFTGTIVANHGLMGKKREAVDHIVSEGHTIAVAVGNSTSDLPLLEHAHRGFLVSDEQEIKDSVQASFVDTKHAQKTLVEAL